MGETVTVEREMAASPETAWALISDVTHMGDFSPENVGCEWIGERSEPVVGARFRGRNRNGSRKWTTTCTVVESEPARIFAFEVSAAGLRVARWEYRFAPTDGGCRATEVWIDQRGRLVKWFGGPVSGVHDRATHNRAGMETTLERLATAAQGGAS